MDFLGQVIAWYTDPAHWTGSNAIGLRLWQHLSLSAASLGAGMAIALPIGLYIGHTGRFARVAVAVSNIGRAVPSLGWLGIAYPIGTALFHRGVGQARLRRFGAAVSDWERVVLLEPTGPLAAAARAQARSARELAHILQGSEA